MKKIFFIALAAIVTMGVISSCSKNDDNGNNGDNELETSYFTIPDATYSGGNIPASTINDNFTDVAIGGSVLNGGSSIITVESAQQLDKFYVGVNGVDGYYTVDAEQVSETRADNGYVYTFTLLISQALDGDFRVRISALTASGEVMRAFSHDFELIEAGTGALQVNMSFNNPKDLDLYLVLPDGHVVYYGDQGWPLDYNAVTEEFTWAWGLDIDSNAACDIDGINSENIFFPQEYVMNGKYTVYVNHYKNCDTSVPVAWTATALYQGNLIRTSSGRNPASGTFRANQPNNYIEETPEDGAVKVMEFTISGAALNPGDLEYLDYEDYTRAFSRKKK